MRQPVSFSSSSVAPVLALLGRLRCLIPQHCAFALPSCSSSQERRRQVCLEQIHCRYSQHLELQCPQNPRVTSVFSFSSSYRWHGLHPSRPGQRRSGLQLALLPLPLSSFSLFPFFSLFASLLSGQLQNA